MKIYYYIFYSFVSYSILGWTLEVLYHLYEEKRFINRGFLYGPICPIYGSTAVILILVLGPFQSNIIYVFLGGALVASVIEYLTGYLLEVFFHTKWWDYSKQRLNFKGYVCIRFSIFWGLLSVVFVKFINPQVSRMTYYFVNNFGEWFYNIILIYLISDIVLTVNSLIAFRKIFIELQNTLVEITDHMDKLLEKTLNKENVVNLQQKLNYLSEIKERLAKRVSLRHKYMLRAYPKITSKRFGAAIQEMRKRFEKKIRND